MKLKDIKETIDSYFDNISEEEFFNLITTKYSMPVVYEMDIPITNAASEDLIPADLDEIDYTQTYCGDIPSSQILKINSSQPLCEMMSNDFTCISYSLSFAA